MVTDPQRQIERCNAYLKSRTATYGQRKQRYKAVADLLVGSGLYNDYTICDVGAGWTDFDYYLRREHDWRGRYWPVDGAFDGIDLNDWEPPQPVDYFIAIEVLEHLHTPFRLVQRLLALAQIRVIVTTPNPAVVNVLAVDPTHQTPIYRGLLEKYGFRVEERSFFGQDRDSLLAWSPFGGCW